MGKKFCLLLIVILLVSFVNLVGSEGSDINQVIKLNSKSVSNSTKISNSVDNIIRLNGNSKETASLGGAKDIAKDGEENLLSVASSAYSIEFNPPLPSSVCQNEQIDIGVKGEAQFTADTNDLLQCSWYDKTWVSYELSLFENDWSSGNDLIDDLSRGTWSYDCTSFFFDNTFEDIRLSNWAGGVEGSTIEVFSKISGEKVWILSTDSYNVDVLYNCDCFSGSCCNNVSRPYKYKSSGNQPIGYTDDYICSGTNSPTDTSYVKKRDYYCSGVDADAHSSDSTQDTCGTCEYCTAGDSTCNYYSSSTTCGTQDCDNLDTLCRNYDDVDKYCSSGSCVAESCNDYTDEPEHTSCGTGKECDGSGICLTCTSHSYTQCSDNDVYYYDACDNKQEKKTDCGDDSTTDLWGVCQGNDLYMHRKYYDRWCENSGCKENSWTQDDFGKTCENGCENGQCKPAPCYKDSDCGTNGWVGNPYCSVGDVWQPYRYYKCNNPGTPQASCSYSDVDSRKEYCDYGCEFGQCKGQPSCQATDVSCGIYPNCVNCNNNDACDGDNYKNYFCSSNSAGCSYTPDNCNDCSCSCGGYNKEELSENGNCNDGKDNDCDGKTDSADSGCEGIQLDIDWEKVSGGANSKEQGNSLIKAYGGYFAIGYTQSPTQKDSYLVKRTLAGDLFWDSNKGHEEGNSIIDVGTYTSIIAGSTNDYYAVEPKLYGSGDLFLGGINIYLSQIDYNGNQNWLGVYGAYTTGNQNTDEYGYDVVKTSGGSFVIVGSSTATANLWKTLTYAVWADSSGNKQIGSGFSVKDGENIGYSIARDGYDFYITGYTTNYQDTIKYISVLKIYPFTTTSWGKLWGKDYGIGVGNSIEVTPDKDVIIAGVKEGNSYLLKIDLNGNVLWNKTLDLGEANSVKIDSNGDYIVLATKNNNIQIFKVKSDGDILWKKTFETSNVEKGRDIIIDGENYVVTGSRDDDLYLMKTKLPCLPECTPGQKICSGSYIQSCGNYDADSCLEWGGDVLCQYGCSSGNCNSAPECTTNSDCGIDGWINGLFCQTNDVYQNFKSFTCLNAGTYDSYCSDSTIAQLKTDCGEDSCGAFGGNYCKSGNVYHSRTCNDKGCSSGNCFNNPYTEEQIVQDCVSGCTNGACNLCIDDCSSGQTRCSGNVKQTCGNYDADSCLEWPSSTSGNGNINCGSDYCGSWGGDYCENGEVYNSRTCHDKGCSVGNCYDNTNMEKELIEFSRVELKAGNNIFSLPRNKQVSFNQLNTDCKIVSENGKPDLAYYLPGDDINIGNYNFVGLDEILYPGQGYFVKVESDCYIEMSGPTVEIGDIGYLDSGQLKEGWNLIGSPTCQKAFNNGTCQLYDSLGILKYGYDVNNCKDVEGWNNGYEYCTIENGVRRCRCEVNNFELGIGYWLKTNNNCNLT